MAMLVATIMMSLHLGLEPRRVALCKRQSRNISSVHAERFPIANYKHNITCVKDQTINEVPLSVQNND
jgi:hypothetical protein